MKRRILLPLVLLAGMTLVGCNWGKKDQSSSKYKVEITNKTELQADWYAGVGNSRGLSIELTPAANPLAELTNGNLVITSSNPSAVSVTGLNLNPLAEGNATVTVKYHGAKDHVDLTILHEQTIAEKYGVTHNGTAEDPLTNEEALTVAKHANYGGEDLHVGGEIASFYHAPGSRGDGKVSWFLKPAQGQTEKFEIYMCLKADGTPLTDDDVWVNGYAIAHGAFTKYNSQYETSAAVFVSCEGNKPQPRTTVECTFAEALAASDALADGADSYNYYKFDAYVSAKEGSNYFLTATQGEELVSATSDADHGSRSYYSNAIEIYNPTGDALLAKLKKNAKVTVTMILKNYHGQAENLLALTADDVVVLTEGTEWSYEQLTVAQALAKINAIDISGVTKDKTTLYAEEGKNYQVTGIVVAKGNTWDSSSQYQNADFYIADTAGHADRLQVFRYANKGIFDALVVDATQVKVTCQLAAYVRVNDGTPSIGARETNANPTVDVIGTVEPTLTDITVSPLNKTVDILAGAQTVQYTAEAVPATAQLGQVTWSVSPADAGVTIDATGLATIAADAVEADGRENYTITASVTVNEQTFSNTATLTVTNDTAGGGGQDEPDYGTLEDPLTPEEAVTLLNELGDNTLTPQKIYVSGVVSQNNAAGNNGRVIWLQSTDGQTAKYFELYNCKNTNFPDLPAEKDGMVGATVTAYGWGTKYVGSSTTYELTNKDSFGNYDNAEIAAYTPAPIPDLTGVEVSPKTATANIHDGAATKQFTASPVPAKAELTEVTWSVSPADAGVTIDQNGLVSIAANAEDQDYEIRATITINESTTWDNAILTVVNEEEQSQEVVDELTLAVTGQSGTTYGEWSGKTVNSSAVYAGQSAGGNDSIQLRSKNSNSGIITTASGGHVKKIVIVWNSNTTDGNKLDVYGNNSAYTSPTQLYNNPVGTKLGSIIKGTTTELVIEGDYTFIGLRSNNGALYITSISITWEA